MNVIDGGAGMSAEITESIKMERSMSGCLAKVVATQEG